MPSLVLLLPLLPIGALRSTPAPRATLTVPLAPSPALAPLDVLEAQLALLQSPTDENLNAAWGFFSPYGPVHEVCARVPGRL
eukprot:scaffold44080_cov36-Tisochrysis_lutea.AAC.1